MFWNVVWPSLWALYAITMFFVNMRQGDTTMMGMWGLSALGILTIVGVGLGRVQRRKEALSED